VDEHGTTYEKFRHIPLILRDELALDRTLLANERTLLAYLRSGMALVIAGATIAHFSQTGWYYIVGVVCIPAGVLCAAVGLFRFVKMNRAFLRIREQARTMHTKNTESPPHTEA
jgi:putative membrane protein